MIYTPTHNRRRGFTLLEMLVTIALVVVLMLAVTQIFSIASQTISGGQALGAAVRDAQSAQPVFSRDLASIAADGAFFNIHMGRIAAFRNREDGDADLDGNPLTIDLDNDGVEETTTSLLSYNLRNHRTDSIAFFARDRFPRQTANDGQMIADQTSNEAAIFYHHLQLADNNLVTTGLTGPGQGDRNTNPNNFYSSQWVLGRSAMLLVEPSSGNEISLRGVPQVFIRRASGAASSLTPLSKGSAASSGPYAIENSRYDLVGTTIDTYRQRLDDYLSDTSNTGKAWWSDIMGGSTRFQASVIAARPLEARTAALQAPVFVPACSQFMIEFAGDFITQNEEGEATDDIPDGIIDYVKQINQIRWYGLPRDTNGDGRIRGIDGDVVPVCDVAGKPMEFERAWPVGVGAKPANNELLSLTSDYLVPVPSKPVKPNPTYVVAWPPKPTDPSLIDNDDHRWKFYRPQLIRITLGIDRPEGRLPDGPSFEYVFKVGQ